MFWGWAWVAEWRGLMSSPKRWLGTLISSAVLFRDVTFEVWLDCNVSVLMNEFKLSLKGLGNFCQLCVLLAWDKIKTLARYQISVLFQSFSFLYLFCRSGYEAQGAVAVRQALCYWAAPLIQPQVLWQHKKWDRGKHTYRLKAQNFLFIRIFVCFSVSDICRNIWLLHWYFCFFRLIVFWRVNW